MSVSIDEDFGKPGGESLHCYEMNACSEELRNECEAFKKGKTTDLKCREHAPLHRILSDSHWGPDGRLNDIILKCHNDCPFYNYYKSIIR
jgi:hypothetical protein